MGCDLQGINISSATANALLKATPHAEPVDWDLSYVAVGHGPRLWRQSHILGCRPYDVVLLSDRYDNSTLSINKQLGLQYPCKLKSTGCQSCTDPAASIWRRSVKPMFIALCRKCDVVTINCPLHKGTRGLFDQTMLTNMKKGAYLVNTARGAIVDRDALVKVLESGHLAGMCFVWMWRPLVACRCDQQARSLKPAVCEAGFAFISNSRQVDLLSLSSFCGHHRSFTDGHSAGCSRQESKGHMAMLKDCIGCAQGMLEMCGTHSLRRRTTPGGRCPTMP